MQRELPHTVIDQVIRLKFEPDETIVGIPRYTHLDPLINALMARQWQLRTDKQVSDKPLMILNQDGTSVGGTIRKRVDAVGLIGNLENYSATIVPDDADLPLLPQKKFMDHLQFAPNSAKLNIMLAGQLISNQNLVGILPTLVRLYYSWTPQMVVYTPDMSKITRKMKSEVQTYLDLSSQAFYWRTVLSLLTPLDGSVSE